MGLGWGIHRNFRSSLFCAVVLATASWSLPARSELSLEERTQRLKTKLPYGSDLHRNFLIHRYGFDPNEIHFGEPYPLILREGLKEEIKVQKTEPVIEIEDYDVIIIGSGPSGLTAGVYLTDAGKKVLILEKNRDLGGLGASGNRLGLQFARGGAYFAAADEELMEIYKNIGLEDYAKQFAIPEPIDSYSWNDVLYEVVWDEKTLKTLPPPFAAFKYALQRMEKDLRVPNQPFEKFPWIEETDSLTMTQWVRRIPQMMEYWTDDPKAAEILDQLSKYQAPDPAEPMKGPLGLLELYGRSALAGHPDIVNAAAFINFYLNELGTRYTGNRGAGEISNSAYQKLLARKRYARFKTGAKVTKIENSKRPPKNAYERIHGSGVEVTYESNGVQYRVFGKDAVFAAPLRLANKAIVDYQQLAPEHHKLTTELEYRDYLVINVHVSGHPWTGAYDLWVRNDGSYSQDAITDIIDGRWMDFNICL
jgi:hypothetical protein